MKAFHFLATDRNSQQHNKNFKKIQMSLQQNVGRSVVPALFSTTPAHTDDKLPPGAWVEKNKKKENHLLKVSFKCFRLSYTPIWW